MSPPDRCYYLSGVSHHQSTFIRHPNTSRNTLHQYNHHHHHHHHQSTFIRHPNTSRNTLHKYNHHHHRLRTHGGVCGAVPVRDGHVVVLEFARDPFPGFGFPQKRVEVREVVMDVQTVLTPSAQRPAAELRALRNQKPDETRSHCIRDDFNPCWYKQWMLLLKPALNWSKVAVL